MQNAKAIFVTGATGNQGGAVTRNLAEQGFAVKALTRNPASPQAQYLKKLNVKIIKGDLDDPGTFGDQLNGVDAIFSVQAYVNGAEKEKKQGIGLADLAKEKGIGHFLYSSVVGADAHTGIPHWESKFVIENHIRQIDLPYTILRPSSFYENFLIPQVKSRLLKGKLVIPNDKNKVQQFMSTEDIGRISVTIFNDPVKYTGKTITMATEQMDMQQVAGTFSEVWGKEIKYQKLPMFITRLFLGKDLYKMFKWINENDAIFLKDLDAFKKEYPGMLSLKDWIKQFFK